MLAGSEYAAVDGCFLRHFGLRLYVRCFLNGFLCVILLSGFR